ncbi:MAG: nitrile hydratase accessory protein [Marinibacterium sp.]
MTSRPPDPVFGEPWHAQVFALTVHLCDRGLFTWPDWTQRFGATLGAHGLSRDLDGGDDYFAAWLETLESLLVDMEAAPAAEVAALTSAWRSAYLATPHGKPVRLSEG